MQPHVGNVPRKGRRPKNLLLRRQPLLDSAPGKDLKDWLYQAPLHHHKRRRFRASSPSSITFSASSNNSSSILSDPNPTLLEVLNGFKPLQAKGSTSLLRVKHHSRSSIIDENMTPLESGPLLELRFKRLQGDTSCNRWSLCLKRLEHVRRYTRDTVPAIVGRSAVRCESAWYQTISAVIDFSDRFYLDITGAEQSR